ncbi:hypothetical protein [Streptomyces corynorhini]|uniref:Uncharacterized protein n=1 Tax=Streptomyces corynorhini TaxID=2282652 RepID=A0A370BGX7_9ACTN|nr:hypothetical protein [Streptomyces corynorhini]RDG39589.1 hypothetical protein DVH02_02975 [Streptomyces corynorhini]
MGEKMKIRRTLGLVGAGAMLTLGGGVFLAPAASAAPTDGQVASSRAEQGQTVKAEVAGKSLGKAAGSAAVSKGANAIQASCWNGSASGRNFYMTCSGNGYRVYVDCSNGLRYTFGTYYYGTWNHTLTCPAGTSAVWGGSIGG